MRNELIIVIPPVAYIGYPTIECATLCALLSKYGIPVRVVELNLALLRYFMNHYEEKLINMLQKEYGSSAKLELVYLDKVAEILDFEENHQYLDSLALNEDFTNIITNYFDFAGVKSIFVILEYMRVSSRAYKSLINTLEIIKNKFGDDGEIILTSRWFLMRFFFVSTYFI